MTCPSCRFEAPGEARFCPRCGASLSLPDDGPSAETRTAIAPDAGYYPGRVIAGRYRLLDLAIEKRDILMPFVQVYSELFAPELTRDPRFEDVLKRMNLPDVRH